MDWLISPQLSKQETDVISVGVSLPRRRGACSVGLPLMPLATCTTACSLLLERGLTCCLFCLITRAILCTRVSESV